ncbi:MAG: BPSL0067 family protein [Pseudomonadota bacterium]
MLLILLVLQACQTTPDDLNCRANPQLCGDPGQASSLPPSPRPSGTAEPDISELTAHICQNASRYRGRVVGDGHCVSLIRLCSSAPLTRHWRPGELVNKINPPAGTIIATFEGDRYPSVTGYHAAIFIEQDEQGIWVWDQWVGKAVHKRLIRFRDDAAAASNTAQRYRVVLSPTE